jgi:hypothetical protein
MGQRKIVIEFTEYQARMLVWALDRATLVAPRAVRNSTGWRKLLEAQQAVLEATEGLPEPPTLLGPKTRL